MADIKAWRCINAEEFCSTIIFAETAGKARYKAMRSDSIGDSLEFSDIIVRREKVMDKYYRGLEEMDWFDDRDRVAMVREAGFYCGEYFDPEDCRACPASEWCAQYLEFLKDEENDRGYENEQR